MIHRFQKIHIAVPEIESAIGEFSVIADALNLTFEDGHWSLDNTQIQLEPGLAGKARIDGLSLLHDSCVRVPEDTRGLNLRLLSKEATSIPTGGIAVDHVVLKTADADDCIRLFRDDLGIRLALDQTVEEWGGRMLFFRTGKMTLEVIEHPGERPVQDFFWGITYSCPDIEAAHTALAAAGVALSDIRTGRKPGTRVATIRSHTLGIPSLLLDSSL